MGKIKNQLIALYLLERILGTPAGYMRIKKAFTKFTKINYFVVSTLDNRELKSTDCGDMAVSVRLVKNSSFAPLSEESHITPITAYFFESAF